jgi:hypothetical protein
MLAHGLVMLVEQRAPFAVTKLGGAPCRFDDIGEHDGRQYAIRRGFAAARTGQELFDLVDDAIAVTGIGKMIAAG